MLIPLEDGALPNLIAFPDPSQGHLEAAHEPVNLVTPGTPDSTTYVLIQTANDPKDLPMYYEVVDQSDREDCPGPGARLSSRVRAAYAGSPIYTI
jgi:hypothetical protein